MVDDQELIRCLRRGESWAALVIYERYKHDLVTLSAALLADRALAEDVVHDVFVVFLNRAREFQLSGSLKSYLCTCVANRTRNLNRAGRSRTATITPERVLPSPDDLSMTQERLEHVEQALEVLPYEQREALALRVVAQESFQTIASHQGVSVNTAQGRFRYALQKLRDFLSDEETL